MHDDQLRRSRAWAPTGPLELIFSFPLNGEAQLFCGAAAGAEPPQVNGETAGDGDDLFLAPRRPERASKEKGSVLTIDTETAEIID